MSRRRRIIAHVLAGLAGVVAAHAAGYLAVFPDAHARAEHLHETGHSYWPAATALAALAAGGLATLAVHAGIRRRREHRADQRGLTVGTLAAFQLAVFVVAEVTERVLSGAPLHEMGLGWELVVGLALQVAVAALVCRLFGGVVATVDRLTSGRGCRPAIPSKARAPWPSMIVLRAMAPWVVAPAGPRAPPRSSST